MQGGGEFPVFLGHGCSVEKGKLTVMKPVQWAGARCGGGEVLWGRGNTGVRGEEPAQEHLGTVWMRIADKVGDQK